MEDVRLIKSCNFMYIFVSSPISKGIYIWVESLTNSKNGLRSKINQVKIAMAVDSQKGVKLSFCKTNTFQKV